MPCGWRRDIFSQRRTGPLAKSGSICYYRCVKKSLCAIWEAAMSYDILAILQEKEPTFSKGQKRIARYIT